MLRKTLLKAQRDLVQKYKYSTNLENDRLNLLLDEGRNDRD